MVLTLIPAMPSFAAALTLNETLYTATDSNVPDGFVDGTEQAQAESVRPGRETKGKILTAVTTAQAFTAIDESQVTFQLSAGDMFTEFEIDIVEADADEITLDGDSARVQWDADDNRIAVDLNDGDSIMAVRFTAEIAEDATGRRIVEVVFPNGESMDGTDTYESVRPLKWYYAQVAGTVLGSVNRLTAIEEWTPNNTWRTIPGARFEIVNPRLYPANEFNVTGNRSAIEMRLNSDFNWVTNEDNIAGELKGTRIFFDNVDMTNTIFADADNYDLNRDRTVLTIFPDQFMAGYDGWVTVEVAPMFSLTRDARLGQEVIVDVDSYKAKGSVVIAKYVDFTTGITVKDVREILAGTAKENKDYRVKIILEDNSLGLASLRDIDMSFANGTAKLIRAEGIDRTKVDAFRQGSRVASGIETPTTGINDDIIDNEWRYTEDYADTFQFTTINNGTNTAVRPVQDEIVLEFYIRGDNNAGGKDMTVNVTGRGMDYKDVKVATVVAPVAMEVNEVKSIELGLQAQEAGTIVLTETKAGALERGREYQIVLNDTDSLQATGQIKILDGYKVEVAEGNGLNVRTSVIDGVMTLTVLRESITTPAKITISNMRVTTDRTVAYGDIKAELIPRDSQTFWAYNLGFRPVTGQTFVLTDAREVKVDRAKTILASMKYMKLATEALTGVQKETVFTIGSTTYTVAGVANTLDAAPYISNNRTMLPIGTVAKLVGATVNYDTTTRTAVFTKDNLVVTMNLDTNMLLVNGSAVPMDAKPEIQNGRAFVSLVYVAQAFGIQNGTDIVYDAAAKTVTLFPNAQ